MDRPTAIAYLRSVLPDALNDLFMAPKLLADDRELTELAALQAELAVAVDAALAEVAQ